MLDEEVPGRSTQDTHGEEETMPYRYFLGICDKVACKCPHAETGRGKECQLCETVGGDAEVR